MRERKWILFLALAAVVAVTGVYVGWRAAEGNERIRRLIIARLRPWVAEGSRIGSLEVGPGRVRLHGIVLVAKDSSYTLTVEHVQVSYSIISLIRHGFNPLKASSEAVLVRPGLTLHRLSSPRPDSAAAQAAPASGLMSSYGDFLGGIRRITLARADIHLEQVPGRRIRIAHELNGWLHNPSGGGAGSFRLAGDVFNSSRRNIEIEGLFDPEQGGIVQVDARVEDSRLGFDLPLLLPGYVKAVTGRVTGRFSYTRGTGARGGFRISEGDLVLKNSNVHFRGVQLKGELEGVNAVINASVPDFNGIPFTISGRVRNIFDPAADLHFVFPQFSIQDFLQEVLPQKRLPLHGKMNADFRLSGSFDDPVIGGRFISKDLRVAGIGFDGYIAELNYKGKKLTVSGEGKHENGMSLQLSGAASLRDSLFIERGTLRLSGDALPLAAGLRGTVSAVPSLLEMSVQGGLGSIRGTGRGQVVFAFLNGQRFSLQPRLDYRQERLGVEVVSGSRTYFSGHADGLLSGAPIWDIAFNDIEDILLTAGGSDMFTGLENIGLSGRFSGSEAAWEISGGGRIYTEYGEKKIADVTIGSRTQKSGERRWDMAGVYYGDGDSALRWQAEGLQHQGLPVLEKAGLGGIADFKGYYPLTREQGRRGTLRFTDFRIEDLHVFFPQLRPYRGNISGGAVWEQDGEDQVTRLQVSLHNGIFNNSMQYDADVHYRRVNGRVSRAGLALTQGARHVISGELVLDEQDRLTGTVSGSSVDFGDLVLAVSGTRLLRGTGDFSMRIKRVNQRTFSEIGLTVPAGAAGPVPFRELTVEAVDTTYPGESWTAGKLTLLKGRALYGDNLKLLAWGDLNHGDQGNSDLSVMLEGDVLSLLPRFSSAVHRARGQGELFIRFAGNSSGLFPGSGRLKIDNGSIGFTDILERIDKLQAEITLPVNSRRVDIVTLTGESEKGTFTVSNRFTDTLPEKMEPLELPWFSLDMGVLRFRTSDRGLKLHFPGLMEPGEKGWIAFGGLNKGEDFYIAGPWRSPRLQGSLQLRNVRLTYPFLPLPGKGADGAKLSFIENIEWNLRVIPRKEVYYTRQIPNPLGDIYIDLQLRDNTGGLRITGAEGRGGVEAWGSLTSTAGTIEAIDHVFRPEQIVFEYPRGSIDPIFSGRASTMIIDSLGTPSTVWLEIMSINDETGMEQAGGPWRKVTFRITTDNPHLARTEADLLSALGYSASQLKDRAYGAIGLQVENLIFRPLLRPIERGLRRHLGLDVVRFSSKFSTNIVQMQSYTGGQWDPWQLFRSSRVTVGKYLIGGLYMTYTGQVHSLNPYLYHTQGLGFRHALVLEYSIRPDLFLEMEYSYDTQLLADRREDKRIWLRHIFPF